MSEDIGQFQVRGSFSHWYLQEILYFKLLSPQKQPQEGLPALQEQQVTLTIRVKKIKQQQKIL